MHNIVSDDCDFILLERPDFVSQSLLGIGSQFAHYQYESTMAAHSGTGSNDTAWPSTPFERRLNAAVYGSARLNTPGATRPSSTCSHSTTKYSVRPRSYTDTEWDRIRPTFEALYVDSKPSLTMIMNTMSHQHNFHATEAMYKKRIRKWGIFRNVKAAQKNIMIEQINKELGVSALQRQQPRENLRKLLRYAKVLQQQNGESADTELLIAKIRQALKPTFKGQDGNGAKATDKQSLTCAVLQDVACDPLSFSINEASLIEHLLYAGQSSISFLLASRQSRAVNDNDYTSRTWSCLAEGRQWLELKAFSEARQTFKRLSLTLDQDLRNPAPEFLSNILFNLANSSWHEFVEWRRAVVGIIALTIDENIGKDHPLSSFMRLFETISSSYDIRTLLYKCLIDQIKLSCPAPATLYAEDLRDELAHTLRKSGRIDEAAELCRRTLDDLPPENLRGRLNMSFQLSYVQLYQNKFAQAVETLESSYELACASSMPEFEFCVARDLARVHWIHGSDVVLAEQWLRTALRVPRGLGLGSHFFSIKLGLFQYALEMFRQARMSMQRGQNFLADFPDLYEHLLATTDDKARWTR